MDAPNVVWITLDSIRADHTTMAGYGRNTTPQLDRIADVGTYFSECIAPAKWTAASSASILTGTYPTAHMVGVDEWRLDEIRQVPRSLSTVPELLKQIGYRTACVTNNNHLSEATGLARGFDRLEQFSVDALKSRTGLGSLLQFLSDFRGHSARYTLDYADYNHTFYLDYVSRKLLREFECAGEPFFLYVHNNDPHHPYTPPITFQKRFTDGMDMSVDEMLDLAHEMNDHIYDYCKGERTFEDEEVEAIEALYDATIAYVDDWVGDLFRYVRSLDVGRTVFVVTADHGDLFGDRGLYGHNIALDDGLIHVPMVVHGLPEAGRNADRLVQHVDVMQTILDVAGADTQQFQGIDLRSDERKFAIAQRGARDRLRGWSPTGVRTPIYPDGVSCLRTREFKYERGVSGGSALYRLPDETTDVAANHLDLVEEFDETLEQWLATDGQPISAEAPRAEYTDEMKARLRDIGYL